MTKSSSKILPSAAALLLAASVSAPAAAQLHESINVEGKYVPEIIRIDRVNTFPKAFRQSLQSRPIGYEQGGVATSFRPSLLTMPATGWRSTREISLNPGYLELGAGSWLNTDLSAGYRFVDNSTTLIGARLQFNSTSLWKPEVSEPTEDVKQERYDGAFGLYASHVVKGYGRLDASLDYHAGYFNYYGYMGTNRLSLTDQYLEPGSVDAPTQTINDLAIRLDWRSLLKPTPSLSYHATARVRHFGYRSLPIPSYADAATLKGQRETNIGLAGGLRMPWDGGSSIGIDADLDMVFLSGEKEVESGNPQASPDAGFNPATGNYALLSLTPYYRFTRGLLDVRLGADLDLAFNAGPEGNRYSFLHVAPDVKFAIQTGQVGLYLNVLGGTTLNTLAHLHELDYYSMPATVSTRPTYTPIDAAFGVNLGPFSGFSMGLEARFRSSKNVPLGGWYQTWLNCGGAALEGITPEMPANSDMLYSIDSEGLDIHGLSFGARLKYEHGETFSISGEATYQPQDGKKGYFNGYDRAKVTAAIKTSFKPIDPLRVNIGFDFRGGRNIYTRSLAPLGSDGVIIDGKGNTSLHSLSLPDLSMLSLSASWSFTPSFSVWLQADNILNRHQEALPMMPTQGIVALAGLKWLF